MPTIPAGQGAASCCSRCDRPFTRKRQDQRFCSKPCAKAASRNAARGSRNVENARRNRQHYERAEWLSYDLNRMPPARRADMLLTLIDAARSHDAALRNILTDPALHGADWRDAKGKLYPDTHSPDALNIAKMANAFCRDRWGIGIRTALRSKSPSAPIGDTQTVDRKVEQPLPEYVRQDPAAFLARIRALRGKQITAIAA